jgi:hypothetical protein
MNVGSGRIKHKFFPNALLRALRSFAILALIKYEPRIASVSKWSKMRKA